MKTDLIAIIIAERMNLWRLRITLNAGRVLCFIAITCMLILGREKGIVPFFQADEDREV